MSLVFMDLDGTLIDGPSSERLFFRTLLRDGVLGPRQLLAFCIFPLRWGLTFKEHVWKKNKAYLYRLSSHHVAERAQHFVRAEIEPRFCPIMRARIGHHKTQGDRIVLLTGTLACIAEEVGRLLDVPDVCATTCHLQDGAYSSDPPQQHPFGPEKLSLATDLAWTYGVNLKTCVAYADSGDDIALLEQAGHPVAVHPRRTLRAVAEARNWEIVG